MKIITTIAIFTLLATALSCDAAELSYHEGMKIIVATPRAQSPSITELKVLTHFRVWQEDGNSTFTNGMIIPFQLKGANYWSADGRYQISELLEADGKAMKHTQTFMLTTWDNSLKKYLRYELRAGKITFTTGGYNPQKREITWDFTFGEEFTSVQIQKYADKKITTSSETFKDGELFRMVSSTTAPLILP